MEFQTGYPIIYRYRNDSDNTIDELANNYVYFPNRRQLNDPFDCYPELLYISKDKKKLQEYIKGPLSEKKPRLSRSELRSKIRQLLKKDNEIADMVTKTYQEKVENFGIGCFTIQSSNFMMWSHYANFHNGVCMRFNIENDKIFFGGINDVNYVKEFERVEYLPYGDGNLKHLFFTKSIMWKMEQEWRVIKPSYGKHYFNPDCLIGLIFGIQAKEEFIRKVMENCEGKYPNLKYYKSTPAKDYFGIILQEL